MTKRITNFAQVAAPSQAEQGGPHQSRTDWTALVRQVQAGDQNAIESLHATFSRGLRYLLARKLGGQDYEDAVQETLVMVVEAIRKDQIREPERLPGFVH